jgi:hypothetical protein
MKSLETSLLFPLLAQGVAGDGHLGRWTLMMKVFVDDDDDDDDGCSPVLSQTWL